jgi:hypothetical protein
MEAAMKVYNVHERRIDAPAQTVGAMLDTLSSPDDAVWPGELWPKMAFDRSLQVGAVGGHADIGYTVTAYEPGRRIEFRFADGLGLVGTHTLEVEADGTATVVRHVAEGHTEGGMLLMWPLVIRWLHDAVLEDLLDKVELGATGEVRRPARWSPWVRFLRKIFIAMEKRKRRAVATVSP